MLNNLERIAFSTSRLSDLCTSKALAKQTGHEPEAWPMVIVKELIDNSLDACEDADGDPPSIGIEVVRDGDIGSINVSDNGPGIAPEVVAGIVDFAKRTSTREAYVSPTRGAQGNALQTIVGTSYVLGGNEGGHVEIAAQGQRHNISMGMDHIRQEPVITHAQQDNALAKTGTSVKVKLPWSVLAESRDQFSQIAEGYALVNPHACIELRWLDNPTIFEATNPAWQKWRPSNPTSVHWYEREHFERLVSAYLAHDADAGKDRTVREFITEFDGLSSTGKQKHVLEETGLARAPLSTLRNGNALNRSLVARLLASLKKIAREIPPQALGIIGEDHIHQRFAAGRCNMDTFQYRKKAITVGGLPFVVETAFAWCPKVCEWQLSTGVNWAAAIPGTNQFRQLGKQSLDSLLERLCVSDDEPVALLLHLACPRVEFLDMGKSAANFDDASAEVIIGALEAVTKTWTRQQKAEDRDASKASRRRDALTKASRITVIEAASRTMADAYMKASSGGRYPAHARQIMYAARPAIQDLTGRTLDDKRFCKELLPNYLIENPNETAGWDVVFDARGRFAEPHTGREVPLGTIGVRQYLLGIQEHSASISIPCGNPEIALTTSTYGPCHRFGAVLFIEKEGFLPLFRAVQLAERFDLALMSTKGTSVVAARKLVDEICWQNNIPLLVLHDFDKTGFSIIGTLDSDTRRYQFKNKIQVIDLGLRLADVKKCGLQSESVAYGKSDPTPNLRKHGATDEEIAFLCSGRSGSDYVGQRVELNAFTSADMVAWIEEKLQEHGINKVIPDQEALNEAYLRTNANAIFNIRMKALAEEIREQVTRNPHIPDSLAEQISVKLRQNPALSWDAALGELVMSKAA